jgi:simple sugar transport system ATP-binding protein
VIIMDEPTAALGVVQTQNVLDVIRRVRDSGVAVVLISHNMPDVLKVADRVEVLRLGRRVAAFRRDDATLESLVAAMTGALQQDDIQ